MVDWEDVYATAEVILNTTRRIALGEGNPSNYAINTSISVINEYSANKNN